jgi:hypothetical protein
MASILSRRFRLPGLMWDLDNTPLGVQHPHDEVAVCPRAVDEAGHVAGDAGVGDDRPQRPQPERFLNVDDEKNTSHDDKHPARQAGHQLPPRARAGPEKKGRPVMTEQMPGELIYEYTIQSTGATSYGAPALDALLSGVADIPPQRARYDLAA